MFNKYNEFSYYTINYLNNIVTGPRTIYIQVTKKFAYLSYEIF